MAASAYFPEKKLAAAHTNQGTAATRPEPPSVNPRSRDMYAGSQDWSWKKPKFTHAWHHASDASWPRSHRGV
jgi:hypothetical protein